VSVDVAGAPVKTGRRMVVSSMSKQVHPREELDPGKPRPCVGEGDLAGEA